MARGTVRFEPGRGALGVCAYCQREAVFPVAHAGSAPPGATTDEGGVLLWSTTTRCSECSASHTLACDASGYSLSFIGPPVDPVWSASRLAWSSRRALAFAKLDGPTYVADLSTAAPRWIKRIDAGFPLAFTPDGAGLVVHSAADPRRIALVSLAGDTSEAPVSVPLADSLDPWQAAWDPTGRRLVLLGKGSAGPALAVVEIATLAVRSVPLEVSGSSTLSLSPDGTRVFAQSGAGWMASRMQMIGVDPATGATAVVATAPLDAPPGSDAIFVPGGDVVIGSASVATNALTLHRVDGKSLEVRAARALEGLGSDRIRLAAAHPETETVLVGTRVLRRFGVADLAPRGGEELELAGSAFALDARSSKLAMATPAIGVVGRPDIAVVTLDGRERSSLRDALGSA